MKAGSQVFQPRFTSHGYQYVEITGIDKPLPLEAVQGVAISSVRELTADYKTSSEKVNRLWSNLVWSNVDNFLTIPTDCPQRNERMGWSGDINVFSRTATYVSNADQFLTRHMYAMRDMQAAAGKVRGCRAGRRRLRRRPLGQRGHRGSVGDLPPVQGRRAAGAALSGDGRLHGLSRDHDRSQDRLEFGRRSWATGWGRRTMRSGRPSWPPPITPTTSTSWRRSPKYWTSPVDAAKYRGMYEKRKAFFNATFVNAEKKTLGIAGGRGGFGRRAAARQRLRNSVWPTRRPLTRSASAWGCSATKTSPPWSRTWRKPWRGENKDDGGVARPKYSLMTGFIGTAWISKALSDHGLSELAYRHLAEQPISVVALCHRPGRDHRSGSGSTDTRWRTDSAATTA